jgi:hypothetical protein
MAELQAFRLSRQDPPPDREGKSFERGEASGNSPATFTRPGFERYQNVFDRFQNQPTVKIQHHTQLKLNFPIYRGDEDPTEWIFKAEQYFEFKRIEHTQQVQLASFHLEKLALQWYRWFTRDRGPMNWEEFTKVILQRFGPTDYDDPSEALSTLKQTTSVIAFQEVFERLSHKVDDLPENFLISSFIAGLKDDIRIDVRVKQPKTLRNHQCSPSH